VKLEGLKVNGFRTFNLHTTRGIISESDLVEVSVSNIEQETDIKNFIP